MMVIGVYQILVGIAAIVKDQFFVVGANYAYQINTTAWGWIHLGIGVVVLAAGFYLFTGSVIARSIAIALLGISAVANFFFLPYYPLWSMLLIALDIFAIWAVATARFGPADDRMMADERMQAGMYGSGGSYGTGAVAGSSDPTRTGERWPSDNAPRVDSEGRHWAPENVKEGAGSSMGEGVSGGQGMGGGQMGETAEQARQRASSSMRGNQPPNRPNT